MDSPISYLEIRAFYIVFCMYRSPQRITGLKIQNPRTEPKKPFNMITFKKSKSNQPNQYDETCYSSCISFPEIQNVKKITSKYSYKV